MNQKQDREHWKKMHESLADPEKREESKRKNDIERMKENRRSDTGL